MRGHFFSGTVVTAALVACGSAAPSLKTDCYTPQVASTLSGVHFDLSGNRCQYTLAEAAAGVQFVYRVVVNADVAGVQSSPATPASCASPDASGLVVEPSVGGGNQNYCMCDCGLGTGAPTTSTLVAGTSTTHFSWNGTNWIGPSDFGNPRGPAFPPGSYQFRVRVDGTANAAPFTMTGSVQFDLVP